LYFEGIAEFAVQIARETTEDLLLPTIRVSEDGVIESIIDL